MQTINIIISTGSTQTDKIFKGVFGEIDNAGNFQIAPELKGIHLFNLLTPEALAQQGIDLSSNVASIEIDENNASAVKATLMHVLRSSWLQTYDQVAVPAGFAKAALDAERAGVDNAIQKAINDLNLQKLDVQVEATFANHPSRVVYGDDDGDEYGGISDSDSLTISAPEVGRTSQWRASSQPMDSTQMPAEAEASNTVLDYASGSLVGNMAVYGSGVGEVAEVVDAVNRAITQLGGHHQFVEDAKFVTLNWHAYMPTAVAAPALPLDPAEADSDATPAPSA